MESQTTTLQEAYVASARLMVFTLFGNATDKAFGLIKSINNAAITGTIEPTNTITLAPVAYIQPNTPSYTPAYIVPNTPSYTPAYIVPNTPSYTPAYIVPNTPSYTPAYIVPVSSSTAASMPAPVSSSTAASMHAPVSSSTAASMPAPVSSSTAASMPAPVSSSTAASMPTPVSSPLITPSYSTTTTVPDSTGISKFAGITIGGIIILAAIGYGVYYYTSKK
jgi:hypothetical protein